MTKNRRVVITGIGSITPLGNSVDVFWKNIKSGQSGAGPISVFDASRFKTKFACEVKGFDPLEYIENNKELRKLDKFSVFALAATQQAFTDSNIQLEKIEPEKAGVIWGSGIGGLDTFYKEAKKLIESTGSPRMSPFFIPKMISDIAAGLISMKYNFQGPNYATVSACASSSHAIINSYNYIKNHNYDIFITGGSEASVTEMGVGGFNALHALSTRNDDPKTASRPFDQNRDGFVLGEGAGCLILEELEHAKKRGAKIYAEIIGSASNADAHHITAPHPEGRGAKKVMQQAIQNSKINPESIDYINVHGTSTPLGDLAEINAIIDVFKDHAYNLEISATKSMTGHLLGAAGAIESIICIKSINDNYIPPTINNKTLDSKINPNLNLNLNKGKEKNINTAICNTFGFGGHNTSVIFKKYTD